MRYFYLLTERQIVYFFIAIAKQNRQFCWSNKSNCLSSIQCKKTNSFKLLIILYNSIVLVFFLPWLFSCSAIDNSGTFVLTIPVLSEVLAGASALLWSERDSSFTDWSDSTHAASGDPVSSAEPIVGSGTVRVCVTLICRPVPLSWNRSNDDKILPWKFLRRHWVAKLISYQLVK